MSDSYSIPAGKARVCRVAGAVFLFLAVLWGIPTLAGTVVPGMRVSCELPQPCRAGSEPTTLLSDESRAAIARDPQAWRGFAAWVARPGVRLGLAGLVVMEDGPVVLLFLSVGLALRRLGDRRPHGLGRALPWLKRAARAAVVLALAGILVDGLRSILLYPGTGEHGGLYFPLDLNQVALPLLLACAAYATAWGLEAGSRAERALADFV